MQVAAAVAVAIVALLHLVFLVLEMFLWTTPFGRRTWDSVRRARDVYGARRLLIV